MYNVQRLASEKLSGARVHYEAKNSPELSNKIGGFFYCFEAGNDNGNFFTCKSEDLDYFYFSNKIGKNFDYMFF